MNNIKKLFILIFLNSINFSYSKQNQPLPKIAYLFTHGVGVNKDQKNYYEKNNIIPKQYKCFAYDGPEIVEDKFNSEYVVFAQQQDIDIVTRGIKFDIQKKNFQACIGVGVSKGAALLINMPKFNSLKALVLESPFADANDVILNYAKNIGLGWLPSSWNLSLANKIFYKDYDPKGIQPIDSIKKIPENVAIIFIHSKEDKLIHINHSRNLYRELITQARKNVYLVETENGDHAQLLNNCSSHNHRITYIKAVHAFYKKYSLPYDENLAKDVDLKIYQPSLEEINNRIEQKKSK